MKKEDFDYLWREGIVCVAQQLEKKLPVGHESYVRLDVSDAKEDLLYIEYDRSRLALREKFFDGGEDIENRIDTHKICACIADALLRVHIFEFLSNEDVLPKEICYVNYKLVFVASLHVLYLLMLSDYMKDDNEKYEQLKKKAGLELPETNPGHDSYAMGRIKTLALNDIYGNDFDRLSYADMMFWIENYNRAIIDCMLNEKRKE